METGCVKGGECSSLKLLLHKPPAFIHQHLLRIYIEIVQLNDCYFSFIFSGLCETLLNSISQHLFTNKQFIRHKHESHANMPHTSSLSVVSNV